MSPPVLLGARKWLTDRVLEGLAEWQLRPLDAVYAVPFIDVIDVKICDSNGTNQPIAACV